MKRESCPSLNESRFVWGTETCAPDRREAKAGLRPCDRAVALLDVCGIELRGDP
jgi:hypothetical protein